MRLLTALIITVPVVDEYREGKLVKAARLSFDSLRRHREARARRQDTLLTRLTNAEHTVQAKKPKKTGER